MKLTFLGSSHGVPSAVRYCSSAVLEVGEAAYVIDAGAPVADQLLRRGIPFTHLRAVFTTHVHSDHTGGLPEFLSLSNWYYKKASFDVFLTEQRLADALLAVVGAMDSAIDTDRLRLRLVTPGVFYEDENIRVTAVPTRHMDNGARPTYSFVIDALQEHKRLVMTGDMHNGDAADFPQIAKDEPSDCIVCEMAHFPPEVIMPIVAACPTKRAIFNHVFCKYDQSMAAIRAAGSDPAYPFPVRAAEDGDVVIL